MTKKIPWFGIILIAIGAVMLLSRAGVVSFGWPLIFWSVVALYGAVKLLNCFPSGQKGGIFWGVLLLLIGVYNVLADLNVFEIDTRLLGPAVLFSVGVALLVMYSRNLREWHILIPGLFFVALGVVLGLAEMDFVYRWDIMAAIRTWWPFVLILFGVSLLLNRRSA